MPAVGFDSGVTYTNFGHVGTFTSVMPYGLLSWTSIGTWGVGVQAANWTFVDKLSHTLRLAYIGGTNDSDIIKGSGFSIFDGDEGFKKLKFSGEYVYMTDKDSAWEVDFEHKYQIYENLTAVLDLAWLKLDLSKSVWGDASKTDDAWKAMLVLRYSF